MLKTLDFIVIFAYLVLVVYIGLKFKDKANKSIADFFVGGRKFPWWLAGLSMVATTFAADTPLAVTELIRKNGISGNWLWWNFLIGGMLTTFFFAKLWRRSEVLTELDLIRIRYSGKEAKFLRILKSFYIGLFFNSLVITWVNLAMLSILRGFFDLEYKTAFLFLSIIFLIAIIYSAVSGIWGVAITDAIQFFIAMTGSVVLAIFVINSDKIGGIEGLINALPDKDALSFFPKLGKNNAGEVLTVSIGAFLAYGLVQWWASPYPGNEPGGGGYIAQRMLSTKNEKHSFFATLFFQIANHILRPFPWILVGLATIILYPQLQTEDFKMGYVYAMKDFLPTGWKGLLLVAFFAAYMSTISTQLNFGSSLLTNDFYLPLIKNKNFNDRKKVITGQIFTVILALISLILTLFVKTISGIWEFVLECGAGVGLVLILRWYWWRINAWSEITATLIALLIFTIVKINGIQFPISYFITVGITVLATLIVTLLTKPTDDKILKSFYEKVRPQGFWNKYSGKNSININLFFAWIFSVVFLYSLLILSGKIIFHFYSEALYALLIALPSGCLMWFFVKKAKILN